MTSRVPLFCLAAAAPLLLGGCIVRTAVDVATAPVRVASKAVDLATTSQSEKDEKRGREIRRREERLGKLDREWRELDEECGEGQADACAERDAVGREMDALLPTIPVAYRD
jgi:hypothetical protein